jgi:hypothetical protein
VRLSAAASSALRSVLAGPRRSAALLGVTPAALYLRTAGEPGVLALVAYDALRLPCALVLPTTRAELPLSSTTVVAGGEPLVGDGVVTWTGPDGQVVVTAVREWAPATVGRGAVAPSALQAMRAALPAPAWLGIDAMLLPMLTSQPAAAVARLLGSGPGLTPAGDDVLAGFLLGAGALGLDAAAACSAAAALAPARTTALSAALLWHAARGECIDELAAVAAALTRHDRIDRNPAEHGLTGHAQLAPALQRLLAVGHTSGAALAVGLATAATASVSGRRAVPGERAGLRPGAGGTAGEAA